MKPATIVVPRWVRALLFMRIPFARRRVNQARSLEAYLAAHWREIQAETSRHMMDVLMWGSSSEFWIDGHSPHGNVEGFYGKGIGDLLAKKGTPLS